MGVGEQENRDIWIHNMHIMLVYGKWYSCYLHKTYLEPPSHVKVHHARKRGENLKHPFFPRPRFYSNPRVVLQPHYDIEINFSTLKLPRHPRTSARIFAWLIHRWDMIYGKGLRDFLALAFMGPSVTCQMGKKAGQMQLPTQREIRWKISPSSILFEI